MRNKLLILSAMALLLPIVPALACFPEDEETKTKEVLFQTEHRGRTSISTEDCQANGLNPGSYFDDEGRIVGSPCDPVEYCSDRDSTDIAVIDYCSDSWNEQQNQDDNISDYLRCPADGGPSCKELKSIEEQNQDAERTDDPNHGEIKGDEELVQDEEEQQEEEEPKETTAETN